MKLPNEGEEKRNDEVPSMSKRTAVYDELVLNNLLQTIHRKQARYVGIVATDVEDLLFLVHEIRMNCPDVVIFTTSANLLFAHSDFTPDLQGLEIFSTYPLFPEIQPWTSYRPYRSYPSDPPSDLSQFPDESAEGAYNATLTQLGDDADRLDIGAPFRPDTPALWLSVVGRGGLWPVRYMSQQSSDSYPQAPSGFDLGELYPVNFLVALVVVSGLCVALSLLALFRPDFSDPSGSITRSIREILTLDSNFTDLTRERREQRAAFVWVLVTIQLVATGFFLLPFRILPDALVQDGQLPSHKYRLIFLGILLVAALVFTVISAIASVINVFLPLSAGGFQIYPPRNFTVHPTGAPLSFARSFFVFVLAVLFIVDAWRQPSGVALLTFVRAASLDNGVSILMPLLFLAICGVSQIGGRLWRLSLLEDARIPLPFLNFEANAESFTGTKALEEKVVERLECASWHLPGWWLVSGLVLGIAAYVALKWIYSLERSWRFELLLFVSVFSMYLYFSLQLLRLALTWSALHQLLRRLYWHPSRDAYGKLQAQSGRRIKLFEPGKSITAIEDCLARARKCLRRLSKGVKIGQKITPQFLGYSIARAETLVGKALQSDAGGEWDKGLRQRLRAQEWVSAISRQLTRLAEPSWRNTSPDDNAKLLEQVNLFIAVRLVDLLRKIFPQLINLASVAMIGLLALMLAISSYPFAERDSLILISWIVLLSAIAVTMTIFIQINRNRIISMLAGEKSGFSWDRAFSLQLFLYGVVPVLALLGAQFPHVFYGIFSWIGGHFSGAKY